MQPVPSLPGWPIHLNLQLSTATRPDSHISISRAPAPTCPSSPTSSFINLHLPSGWLMAGSIWHRCASMPEEMLVGATGSPVSPNEPYLCLRLRKEFRLEFLLPHCQVLACHTAPSRLLPSACQPGGHLQRQSCLSGGRRHGQSTLHPCGLRAWAERPYSRCPHMRDSEKQEVGGLHSSIPFPPIQEEITSQ